MARLDQSRKRILVTGGAGFLGSHLIDRLIGEGHAVVCLDNLQTGSRRNIEHLAGNPDFTFVEQDVTDAIDLEVDAIYNLACPASPPHYQRDPIRTMKTSVLGALNVLELAKRRGCRVLQASTSEVYGDPNVHPQTEDYWGHVNPIGPRACYDEGKRSAETLFFDHHRHAGVRIKVARIFNTYGPRMDHADGRVVSNFVVQALRGEPITLYGDGSQTRSFCYVDDLVDGLMRLMNSDEGVTGPVNLGNPNEFTIRELAERAVRMTGSGSTIEYRPLPEDDPRQRQPDISRAKATLGWEPKVQLEEGLGRTIAYFRTVVATLG
ncbi:MAG: UDP-glucuronic acid decarboxylase family protein [Rhizobiaceae bacterium]